MEVHGASALTGSPGRAEDSKLTLGWAPGTRRAADARSLAFCGKWLFLRIAKTAALHLRWMKYSDVPEG